MADYPFLGAQYHKDKTVFRVQSEHAAQPCLIRLGILGR